MLVQEIQTDMEPTEVVRLAKDYFLTRFSPNGAYVESESEGHVALHIDAGELVIGTGVADGRTLVRGSTSRLHHELSQFLTMLGPPESVRQNLPGPGVSGAG